jgi:uroporphyrinogen-III decarboxylase
MAYSGVIEDFLRIRENKVPKRIPCCALSEEFDVKWYGKYNYEEFCQDGEKMFEVYKAAIEFFDYDWAWLQIDDCFEFEPLGVKVKGEGDILRATCGYLPANWDTLKNLPTVDPGKDGRMPEKLKAIRMLKDHFQDSVLITGSCAAPFSAVGLTYNLQESMMMMLTDPELLYASMEYWKEFYKRYIKAQQDAGADAIWLGDCNAFSSMVSVPQYTEHILPITKELVSYCEKELNIMIWLHNSEVLVDHVLSHAPLRVSFENIGPAGVMSDIRAATRGRQPISGNLDPLEVLWKGNPDLIKAEVARIMLACKMGGGYIFNSGEMNPAYVPEENMMAYMNTAHKLADY